MTTVDAGRWSAAVRGTGRVVSVHVGSQQTIQSWYVAYWLTSAFLGKGSFLRNEPHFFLPYEYKLRGPTLAFYDVFTFSFLSPPDYRLLL